MGVSVGRCGDAEGKMATTLQANLMFDEFGINLNIEKG